MASLIPSCAGADAHFVNSTATATHPMMAPSSSRIGSTRTWTRGWGQGHYGVQERQAPVGDCPPAVASADSATRYSGLRTPAVDYRASGAASTSRTRVTSSSSVQGLLMNGTCGGSP